MCYNKSTVKQLSELSEHFPIFKNVKDKDAFDELPMYNALRLQRLPIFAMRDGELRAFKALWWLIPHWSKTGKAESTAFNARVETIDTSRLFAPYFKSSRCLIPADAFFEYSETMIDVTVEGKRGKKKKPYVFRMKDESPFMLGGVFSVWVDPKTGEEKPSYTVITTTPNALLEKVHDRMPAIIPEKHFSIWLDRDFKQTNEVKTIAAEPYPHTKMKSNPVDADYLYDRTHNDERCWEE